MSQLRAGRLTLVTNSASSIVLPQVAVVQGTDGVSRFESASSYLARNRDALLGAIIPDTELVTRLQLRYWQLGRPGDRHRSPGFASVGY